MSEVYVMVPISLFPEGIGTQEIAKLVEQSVDQKERIRQLENAVEVHIEKVRASGQYLEDLQNHQIPAFGGNAMKISMGIRELAAQMKAYGQGTM